MTREIIEVKLDPKMRNLIAGGQSSKDFVYIQQELEYKDPQDNTCYHNVIVKRRKDNKFFLFRFSHNGKEYVFNNVGTEMFEKIKKIYI